MALFNGVWTALHSPAITLPVLTGPVLEGSVLEGSGGLPLGLQLIGRTYEDDALLDVADTVFSTLA